jgi:hypothetical protein
VDVSFNLFCFHFYFVNKSSLYMSFGSTLVLSLDSKVQDNLQYNDIDYELYIDLEIVGIAWKEWFKKLKSGLKICKIKIKYCISWTIPNLHEVICVKNQVLPLHNVIKNN